MTSLFCSLEIFAFILVSSIVLNFEVIFVSAGEDRESLDFILPNDNEAQGRRCLSYSRYFCCDGYRLTKKQKDREPEEGDKRLFESMVRHSFANINWFSLRDQDQAYGGCCSHQSSMYLEYGQKLGLSPIEYYNKLYNYKNQGGRELVYVKARWHSKACMNLISQVGFGRGKLKVVGGRGLTTNFAMPPAGNQTAVPYFKGANIKTRLSFSWFMINNICGDFPFLCQELVNRPSTSGN